MKKSNKKTTKKFQEGFLKDAQTILDFVAKFESQDIEKMDVAKVTKEAKQLEKKMKKKYKEHLPEDFEEQVKKRMEDDLDTEE